jgi:mannosyltransferase OCH1-like enzyme
LRILGFGSILDGNFDYDYFDSTEDNFEDFDFNTYDTGTESLETLLANWTVSDLVRKLILL